MSQILVQLSYGKPAQLRWVEIERHRHKLNGGKSRMHRCISFLAPSSSSVSALTLQLVVATSVHAFPDRTTSDGEDPCRVLTLAYFVEVSGANINGMVSKLLS